MTREEIIELFEKNTEELVHEIGIYLHAKLEDDGELNGPEIPVFVLWMWNLEVLNGGLCQFFVNDGEYASLVPASLKTIGANEYTTLLCDFVEKNGIDLEDMSEFALNLQPDKEDFSPYIELYEKYPFEDFDDAFLICMALIRWKGTLPTISTTISMRLSQNNRHPKKAPKEKALSWVFS